MPAVAKSTAAEPAPEAQSPERVALARAIDRHRRAVERLEWLSAGEAQLQHRSLEASGEIGTAEGLVAAAKKDAALRPSYIGLLTGTDDGAKQLEVAERRLQQAETNWQTLQSALVQLREDIQRASRDVGDARHQVKEGVGAVARDTNAVRGVIEQTHDSLCRFLSLLSVWDELFKTSALPEDAKGRWASYQGVRNTVQVLLQSRRPEIDGTLAAQFREAFKTMAEDADAALPTLE